jgi:hypothetical protein
MLKKYRNIGFLRKTRFFRRKLAIIAENCDHNIDPWGQSFWSIFSNYSYWAHHPVNWDDHLLAHAMASDFSVAWQCLSKRTIVFSLRIKLHVLIQLCGSLLAQF